MNQKWFVRILFYVMGNDKKIQLLVRETGGKERE